MEASLLGSTPSTVWQSKYTFYPDYYVTMGPGMYIFDYVAYSGDVQDKLIHVPTTIRIPTSSTIRWKAAGQGDCGV